MTVTESKIKWAERQLGEFFRVKHGYAFKGEYFSSSGDYIVLTPGNFYDEGGFKKKANEKYYTGQVPSGFILTHEDLIVAMTEQAEGLLGSAAIVPEDNWYLHNQRLGLITNLDKTQLDKKFLYYLFNSQNVRGQIRASANGVKVRHTSPDRIYQVKFRLPPLPTQRKIAGILSAYDRLIENNTRRIEILEEMARSIYREWFVKFRFPGHEQVQMVDSELGLIPEGWEVLPIDELIKRGILEKNQDGNHGEKHPKSTDYVPSGIPFIMAKDLSTNIIDLHNCQFISYEQAQSLRVGFAKTGDVLLTHKATMGRVAIVPKVEKFIVLTPQITYFRIKDYSSLNQSFLYCTFTSDRFQDILSGQSDQSTRKFISITNQRNIKILYPSPNWINKFGEIIKDVLGLKESLYSKNLNLRQTRDLLLPRLISGEIDVENLDINTGAIAA